MNLLDSLIPGAAEEEVDEGGDVADGYVGVTVAVTTQEGTALLAEVAGVARATVDVGVGSSHMIGIKSRTLSAKHNLLA